MRHPPPPIIALPTLVTPGTEPTCDRPGPNGETCQRAEGHPADVCAAVVMTGPDDAPMAHRATNVVTWLYEPPRAVGRAPARPSPHHWERRDVTADTTDFSPAEWSTLTLYAAAVDQRFGVDSLGAVYCPDPRHASFTFTRGRPTETHMSDLLVWTREHWECRSVAEAVPVQDVENVER